jgi:membrane associated rhomboid family serine protease
MAAVYVLVEIINLFLVYQAEDSAPNTTDQATNFAYMAHFFGLMMAIVYSGYDTLYYR